MLQNTSVTMASGGTSGPLPLDIWAYFTKLY